MKLITKISLCCLFIGLSLTGGAQNLVPNPSFEEFTSCPDDWYQVDKVNSWEAYRGSPDYFNLCGAVDSFSTPQNFMGNQIPSSGNAYVGLIPFAKGTLEGSDEMIGTQLSQPLVIGIKYYVSFKVVLKYNNDYWICCANNKIGAKFTSQLFNFPNPPAPNSNPPIKNNTAHIYTDSIINDTTSWTQIFGSFVADSAYNQIIIGNFFSNANVSIDDIIPARDYSYYFVDDVCVSTDSSYAANYVYTGIKEESLKDNFNIYPNPVTDYFHINQDFPEPYDLVIYNTLGQKVYEEKNIASNSKTINTTPFTKGLLLINIKSNNQSINYKILKL